MRYTEAVKLRAGDEVVCKETGRVLKVIYKENRKGRKECILFCDDGYEYRHDEVK